MRSRGHRVRGVVSMPQLPRMRIGAAVIGDRLFNRRARPRVAVLLRA